MNPAQWDKRFWASTRGRVITLLRRGSHTVNELAAALALTDNAVRAHLTALERDGLVRQSGSRAGTRRPNLTYDLTPEGERLFYRAYGPLVHQLLNVLAERLPARKVEEVLREVGRRMAAKYGPASPGTTLPERLQQALGVFGEFGGVAEVERQDGTLLLHSFGCPLAAAVTDHPELCRLMESLLGDLLGVPVQERCRRGPSPQCYFEIRADGA